MLAAMFRVVYYFWVIVDFTNVLGGYYAPNCTGNGGNVL